MFKVVFAILSVAIIPRSMGNFEVISLTTKKRININGVTESISARVFYAKSGKMVSYLSDPQAMVILNDEMGQLSIHYINSNTVTQKFDNQYGTQNSHLYYFLQHQTHDLGLETMGFKFEGSKFDDGLLVSKWIAPENMQNVIAYVELVHEQSNPIFMSYHDPSEKPIKKVYFYDYGSFRNVSFPQSITEINYTNSDSTISKTTFSDIEFDNQEALDSLNYRIPSSATILK